MTAYPLLAGLQLQVPVAFPYVITGRFDDPRTYTFAPSKLQKHEGVDFAPARRVWPFLGVLPALPGRVVKVGWDNRGYGNYVVMEHKHNAQTLLSWYGHLKTVYVAEGDNIPTALWLLGEAGMTGFSTGVHLHFTLQYVPHGLRGYVVDYVIDPMPYFAESHYAA